MTFPVPGRVPRGSAHLSRLAAGVLALFVAACQSNVSPTPPAGSPAEASTAAPSSLSAAPPPTCPPPPTIAPRPTETSQAGWWEDRVFYEVFVRSFADGDGDGVGDLRGLIGRLDYLNDGDPTTNTDLGVTGLWLMPTFPSPSYHGYDVTDFQGVNPDYGSMADMRALVAAAHARGIAVLLDLPINHTSDTHPWFVDSRKVGSAHDDWYVWSDTPLAGNWHRDGKRLYYGAFGADMPDLNLRNPKVTAAIDAAATFWLTDIGVDGFRIDAAKHLVEDAGATENTPETKTWLADFRTTLEAARTGTLLIGEVWDPSPVSSAYVPASLDMTFEFGLATAYLGAVKSGQASSLAGSFAKITSLYPPAGGFGAFLSNHDMDRVASQLSSDPTAMRLAASLLLTGPGVPFVYYGEELGMTGAKPDERIRTPMRWDTSAPAAGFSRHAPWEALSDDPADLNVASESADPASLLSWYRDLIAFRASTHAALSAGAYLPVDSDSGALVASIRATPTDTLLVIANLSDAAVAPSLTLAGGPLCGSARATILLGGDEGATVATAPVVTPSGGFAGYRPLPEIPARSVVVVNLAH